MEGGGGTAAAEDEDLASMEEKRAAAEIWSRVRGPRDRSRPFRAPWPRRRRRRRRGSGVRGFYWLRGSEGQRDEEAEPPAEDRRSGRIGRGASSF
jgi:hypothetical protein